MPFLLAAALGVTGCGSSSSSAAAGSAASAAHDAAEALAIADRVAVLHSGRLAQVATPADVYAEPDDLTVARLTGPVSVLHAPVSGAAADQATIGVGQARATVPCSTAPGADPAAPGVLVRPDWARLGGADHPDRDGDLPGAITEIRFRGPHTDYHLDTPAGPLLIREAGPPRAECGPARRSWRWRSVSPSTRFPSSSPGIPGSTSAATAASWRICST